MNWYFVLAYGVTLFGPAPINKSEFFDAVREHVKQRKSYMQATRSGRLCEVRQSAHPRVSLAMSGRDPRFPAQAYTVMSEEHVHDYIP
jgi:hypothetical protein